MQPNAAVVASEASILVVDDDPAVCNALKFALELENYAVRTYASGAELLGEPALPPARCLVIDYRLPGMNGLELLARLRRLGIAAPAILITTNPGNALRVAAADAGTHIVEKPLLTNALSDAIRHAISLGE
jgi:two-component system response regulator FixJ